MPRWSDYPAMEGSIAALQVLGLDPSDLTKSKKGTVKRFTVNKFLAEDGVHSVLYYGADPTGVEDSTAAFQAAIDASPATLVPFGDYRIDGLLTIDHYGKIIVFDRGAIPNIRYWQVPSQAPFDATPGVRVRLFKDDDSTNSHFIKIRAGGVRLDGFPVFDVSDVTTYSNAAVYYAANEDNGLVTNDPRVRGWGGWLQIIVQGSSTQASNASEGINCVECAWDNPATDDSFLTMMEWEIYGQFVRYGCYLPALATGEGQFANSLRCKMYLDGCKQAVFNESFNAARFEGVIQARNLLDATEFPKAVAHIGADNNTLDFHAYDLNSNVDGNGHYRMSYFCQNNGKETRIIKNSSYDQRTNQGFLPVGPVQTLLAPNGFIPHALSGVDDFRSGLTISTFHNELSNLSDRATALVMDLYAGDEVSDFSTLTDDSVTAGITSNSSQLTVSGALNRVGNFYGGAPTFRVDANAVTDEDYLEFHWTGITDSLEAMYFSFTSNGGFSKCQVIRKLSSVVVDNVLIDTPSQNDEDPANLIKVELSGNSADECIVRFIGFLDSTKDYGIQDFSGFSDSSSANIPLLSTQGGQTVYGNLTWNDGGYNDPHPVIGSHHLWVDSTGDLRIKDGAPTSDTDGVVVGSQT